MKTFAIALLILLTPAAGAQISDVPVRPPAWSAPAAEGAMWPAAARRPRPARAAEVPAAMPATLSRWSDAAGPDSVLTTVTAGPVRLGPGDLLDIGVFDCPELTARVRVSSDGDIAFPLLGKLQVGGMTPLALQSFMAGQLAARDLVKDPQVAVFVEEYANQEVYVLGEVQKPGSYPILGSHRLFDFISAAGGFTLRAGKSIVITRGAHPEAPETVRFARDPDFAAGNPDLGAGDTVYVKPAGVIYVVGDVNKPGGFLMDSDEQVTVIEAVALAEGPKSTAALSRARLIRKTAQGHSDTPVDLKKVFRLQAQDLALQDQDVLYVPSSAAKAGFKRGTESVLGATLGAMIYHF